MKTPRLSLLAPLAAPPVAAPSDILGSKRQAPHSAGSHAARERAAPWARDRPRRRLAHAPSMHVLIEKRNRRREPADPGFSKPGSARALGPFGERLQLRPCDLRMGAAAEAAVGAGDHVLRPDAPGEATDALGHQLRMLDPVGGVRDDPGDEDLAVGKLHILPHG